MQSYTRISFKLRRKVISHSFKTNTSIILQWNTVLRFNFDYKNNLISNISIFMLQIWIIKKKVYTKLAKMRILSLNQQILCKACSFFFCVNISRISLSALPFAATTWSFWTRNHFSYRVRIQPLTHIVQFPQGYHIRFPVWWNVNK